MLTAFHPIPSVKAVELVQAAGLPHAVRLIRDHAAADLVKTYAAAIETWHPAQPKRTQRGATIPPELWQRMIRDDVDEDAWTGGTVRFLGSDLIGGAPTVHVTGIGFNPADLERMINQQAGPAVKAPMAQLAAVPRVPVAAPADPAPSVSSTGRKTGSIRPGALVASVAETMEALSCGKTTVYKLLKAGKLERAPPDSGTRVMAESVRRYAGLSTSRPLGQPNSDRAA